MKLAYANARFRPDAHDGANAHVRQFAQNTVALGHELWMWPGVAHPQSHELPKARFARTMKLREMDVLYVRVEHDRSVEDHIAPGLRGEHALDVGPELRFVAVGVVAVLAVRRFDVERDFEDFRELLPVRRAHSWGG